MKAWSGDAIKMQMYDHDLYTMNNAIHRHVERGSAGHMRARPQVDVLPCSGLEVFVDEEFAPGSGPAAGLAGGSGGDEVVAGEGKWAQLETWEQGRKENVQAPGKWAGVKLKQKKGLIAPAAPILDIPQDEELEELGETPSHVLATPQASLAHYEIWEYC